MSEAKQMVDRLMLMANIGRKEAAYLSAMGVSGQTGTSLKVDAMADALTDAAVFIEKTLAAA